MGATRITRTVRIACIEGVFLKLSEMNAEEFVRQFDVILSL